MERLFWGNGNGIAVSAAFSRRWHAGVYDAGCVGKDWREGRIGAGKGRLPYGAFLVRAET